MTKIKHSTQRNFLLIASIIVLSFLFLYSQQKQWDAAAHDKTNFPLTGKHRTVACPECHREGVLAGTPSECEACHWYRKQDDRYRLQLGLHCSDCHTPSDWKKINPGSWEHTRDTGYALIGSHKFADCFQCHLGNTFTGRQADCIGCHRKDYDKVDEPDHKLSRFPEDCEMCHNMTAWAGAKFTHSYFPLKGMHKTTACSACHKNNIYEGIPSDCVDCHLDEYNKTTNPNHKQAGYSTECEKCHGDNALTWQGAIFDHNAFWPLRGAHKGLDCIDCHAKGYNISSKCISCHLADYNNTKDPDHRKAGFSTDCEYCHLRDATTWSQTNFDHQFPIFSGKHVGLSCSECHTTANYYEFSCTDCHAHNKAEMDGAHDDIAGYSYNSQACYSCHPAGQK